MTTYKISMNKNIINKSENKKEFNNFSNEAEVTIKGLIEVIRSGTAVSNIFSGGIRKRENFIESSVIQLDFDSGMSWEEALSDPFFKDKASFIYTTVSHTDEKHRFRAVLLLKESIKDSKTYESAIKGLLKKYPQADPSCKDCARMFYGNSNAVIHEFGAELSSEDVELLVQLDSQSGMKAITNNSYIERASTNPNNQKFQQKSHYSEHDVREMLSSINPMPGYTNWIRYIWAVRSEFDNETTFQIINPWSPDDCDGQKLRQVINDYKPGHISIGFVVKQAVLVGYKMPSHLHRDRTPGQVAHQDLFNSGNGYIAINRTIYEYKDGYYQEITEQEVRSIVARYFNCYKTPDGKNSLAIQSKIDDAISTVKDLLNTPNDTIVNPPGLNCKNGFLALSYNEKNQPYFSLQPHSVDRICLYRSNIEYNGNASTVEFDEAIDKILPQGRKRILMQTISTCFDLRTIRKKHGRGIKTLFLIGEGANGKDTIKTWLTDLIGPEAVTSVSLQNFKEADKGKSSNLLPLIGSLVNWPSENAPVSLDNCEKLKIAVTGDDLTIEPKYKGCFVHKPCTVFLFNTNHYPYIGGNQAALDTRYAAIGFDSIFRTDPDPNNSKEIKADPRLKDDPDFIAKVILPGFLKRLIEAFIKVHQNGIDYTPCDELMEQLKENSSHIYRFKKEYGLGTVSSLDEAISASKCYEEYQRFCKDEDLIHMSGNNLNYNDPSEFDKVRRTPGDLLKSLKKYIPGLDSSKHKGERVWNLKFTKSINSDYSPFS